jgi:hypothetical protein
MDYILIEITIFKKNSQEFFLIPLNFKVQKADQKSKMDGIKK